MKTILLPLIVTAVIALALTNSLALTQEAMPQEGVQEELIAEKFTSQFPFFTGNRGQFDGQVSFQSRAPGATYYFLERGMVLVFTRANESALSGSREKGFRLFSEKANEGGTDAPGEIEVMSIVASFAGANNIDPEGEHLLEQYNNYFIGNDSEKWYTNVPNYGAIRYRNVYEGIDLLYYGKGGAMKYEFIVSPGADPGRIRIRYEGIASIAVNGEGEMEIQTPWHKMIERKPVAYQLGGSSSILLESSFEKFSESEFGFRISSYNPSLPLVIDPTLDYSTYLGGSNVDTGAEISIDSSGNAYVTGMTASSDFPMRNPYQGTRRGVTDVFITKMTSQGNNLVYSTYLGGSLSERGHSIAIDSTGNAYVTGETDSSNFPTKNAYQGSYGGGTDAFVTKLNPQGNDLMYSTYLGGPSTELGKGIAVDSGGNAYVAGWTDSTNFPTKNAYQGTMAGGGDVFITKFNTQGNDLVYSTYLGGYGAEVGDDIAIDSSGNAYVTGMTQSTNFPTKNAYQGSYGGGLFSGDAFVTKLNPQGSDLVYSTYLGGSDLDIGYAIAVNTSSGNAYVTGYTYSTNFPTRNPFQGSYAGGYDAFVAKFNPQGNDLVYSTYLGDSDSDEGHDITVDSSGNAYVTGYTRSLGFPTKNAYQGTMAGGTDVFISKFNPQGNDLVYSTYLGGDDDDTGYGISIDSLNNAYVSGVTDSYNFPTKNAFQGSYAGSGDAFVAKLGSTTGNAPPVALFTWSPSSPKAGESILFNASASYDPDGYITRYEWDWDSNGIYDEARTAPITSHSWSSSGSYPVTLRVTDNDGLNDTERSTVNVGARRYLEPLDTLMGAIHKKTTSAVYNGSGAIDSVTEAAADVYVRGYGQVTSRGLEGDSFEWSIVAAEIAFATASGNALDLIATLVMAAMDYDLRLDIDASVDQVIEHWGMTGPVSRLERNADILLGPDFQWMRDFDYASSIQTAVSQGYSRTGVFTGTLQSLNGTFAYYNTTLAYREPDPAFSFPEAVSVLQEQNRWLDGQLADGMILTPEGSVQNYKRAMGYRQQFSAAESMYVTSGTASSLFSVIGLAGSAIAVTGVGTVAGIAFQVIGTAGSFVFGSFETSSLFSMLDNWGYTQVYWVDDLQNINASQDKIIRWLEEETESPKAQYTSGRIVGTDMHYDVPLLKWVFANQPEWNPLLWWLPETAVLKDNEVRLQSTGSSAAKTRVLSIDRTLSGEGFSRLNSVWPAETMPPATLAPGQSWSVTLPYTGEFILLEAFEPHVLNTYLWMGGRIVHTVTDFYWIVPLLSDSPSSQPGPSCCAFSTEKSGAIDSAEEWGELTGSGRKIINTTLGANQTAEANYTTNATSVRVDFTLAFIPSAEADLHAFDRQGRHVGYNETTGMDDIRIPGAAYSGSGSFFERIAIPVAGAETFRVMAKARTPSPVEVIAFETPDRPAVLGIQPGAVYTTAAPAQQKNLSMAMAEIGGQEGVGNVGIAVGRLENAYGDPLAGVTISPNPANFSLNARASIGIALSLEAGSVPTYGRQDTRFAGSLAVTTSNAGNVDIPLSILVLGTSLPNITLGDSTEPTVQGVHISALNAAAVNSSGMPGGLVVARAYAVNATGSGMLRLEFAMPGATTGSGRMQAYKVKGGWTPLATLSMGGVVAVAMDVDNAAVVLASVNNTFNISIPAPSTPWSLLSLPMAPFNATLPEPVASVLGDFEVIFAYDSSSPNPWLSYDPARPPFLNSLKSLNETQGFWIKMKRPAVLETRGLPQAGQPFRMKRSWNLIGYPSLGVSSPASAFQEVADEVDTVLGYDSWDIGNEWKVYDPERPPFLNTLVAMEPGFGYWVKAFRDADWQFNGTAYGKSE